MTRFSSSSSEKSDRGRKRNQGYKPDYSSDKNYGRSPIKRVHRDANQERVDPRRAYDNMPQQQKMHPRKQEYGEGEGKFYVKSGSHLGRSPPKHDYRHHGSGYIEPHEASRDRTAGKKQNKWEDEVVVLDADLNKPQSEIKIHFKFQFIKVQPKLQKSLMDLLRKTIEEKIGTIYYFQKSNKSPKGYVGFELGLDQDTDAINYLNGKFGNISFKTANEKIILKPEPTEVFDTMRKYWTETKTETFEITMEKDEREAKNSTRHRKRSKSYSSSHSSYQSGSIDRKSSRQRKYEKKSHHRTKSPSSIVQPTPYRTKQGKSMQEFDEPSRYLFMFGVHSSVTVKDIQKVLYEQNGNSFYSRRFHWHKVKDSNCWYLQIYVKERQVEQLMQMVPQMQLNGQPFIIIDGQSSKRQDIQRQLKKFQINIKLPHKVSAFHVLNNLSRCGRVIQMTSVNYPQDSENQMEQKGDIFNVVFNSVTIVKALLQIKETSGNISISQPQQSMLVYRPSKETELFLVKTEASADYCQSDPTY